MKRHYNIPEIRLQATTPMQVMMFSPGTAVLQQQNADSDSEQL